jgi:hypothetical protein
VLLTPGLIRPLVLPPAAVIGWAAVASVIVRLSGGHPASRP